MTRVRLLLALLPLAAAPCVLPAQEARAPSLTADPAAGYRPVLAFGDLLADKDLADAVHSGLPVRLRVRIELWRDRLIDELAGSQAWSAVLLYDPLDRDYSVHARGTPGSTRVYPEYEQARQALASTPSLVLRPSRPGTYYYTAAIQIETLSLSDLEELERWLQGELQPAVAGERSIPEAVGEGAKRLLIRVLGLPARTVDLKTARFKVSAAR